MRTVAFRRWEVLAHLLVLRAGIRPTQVRLEPGLVRAGTGLRRRVGKTMRVLQLQGRLLFGWMTDALSRVLSRAASAGKDQTVAEIGSSLGVDSLCKRDVRS